MPSSRHATTAALMVGTATLVLVMAAAVRAQSPTYHVGRTPTAAEIAAADSAIGPSGAELPAGASTAAAGRGVYTRRCQGCHGATGKEGPNDVLAGGTGSLTTERPLRTVGSYWPYATTLFDYIRRAMPYMTPGVLTDEEVYGATAYVLYLNGLVGENDVVDAKTLPALKMPNRSGFVKDARPDVR